MDVDDGCKSKLSFDTKEAAQAAANQEFYNHGKKLTVYKCSQCNLWHLTSG